MKLFRSLLVAPATIGLLAPLSASATEVNLNAISNYSDENIEVDINEFKSLPNNNLLLSGGEGLVDSDDHDGGFSETTTASFSVDAVLGAVDGTTNESTSFDYQMNIGLSTSFTGEDSLDVTIDVGGASSSSTTSSAAMLNLQATGTAMNVDGITYSFPLGGTTVLVGDTTDISSVFTGACVYSAFTDQVSNCGTGSSVGVGGKGVTVAASYAFDSGFSLAGGVSSTKTDILTEEGADLYGIEGAYTTDSYGVSVAYVSDDGATSAETTYWGVQAFYSPEGSFPSISVGYETEETSGTEKSGYFVGLSWAEVGPGSVNVGLATNENYTDSATEYLTYEASYSYPVNDGITVTPGVFIKETASTRDDETGFVVKTSFSF